MTLKNVLILVFVLKGMLIIAQNDVCESSSEFDIMMELNNIEKCAIQKNTESNINNDVAIATRNRYVRTKSNPHLSNIKKNITNYSHSTKAAPKKKKTTYVKYKNLTEKPMLLTLKGASIYKEDLEKALKDYVDENLKYPVAAKRKGTEAMVWASFVIDTKGFIKNIVTSGPIDGEVFEVETERLLKTMPNFIPGKLNGEYVNIKYLMTVDFALN